MRYPGLYQMKGFAGMRVGRLRAGGRSACLGEGGCQDANWGVAVAGGLRAYEDKIHHSSAHLSRMERWAPNACSRLTVLTVVPSPARASGATLLSVSYRPSTRTFPFSVATARARMRIPVPAKAVKTVAGTDVRAPASLLIAAAI